MICACSKLTRRGFSGGTLINAGEKGAKSINYPRNMVRPEHRAVRVEELEKIHPEMLNAAIIIQNANWEFRP